MYKYKKWITGILLSLILVSSSLLFPVSAAEAVATTHEDSITITFDSQEAGLEDVNLYFPDGYSFSDVTSIFGSLTVYKDDLTPVVVPFSCIFSYASAKILYANIVAEPFFPIDNRFLTIFQHDPSYLRLNYSSLNSDYDSAYVSSLTITFGDNVKTPGSFSVYQEIYDIIHHFIYGGVELTSDMSLTLTLLATTACVFVVAIPFVVVFWSLSFFFKRWF